MKGIKSKNPMQTRHGRVRYKAFSVAQLEEALEKTSVAKVKHKIKQELNRKVRNAPFGSLEVPVSE